MSEDSERDAAIIARWEADRANRKAMGGRAHNATLSGAEREELGRLRMENAELLRKLEKALQRGPR